MTRLAALLMTNATFQLTVRRTDAVLNGISYPATNDLLTIYPGADGIKTGRTTGAAGASSPRRHVATAASSPPCSAPPPRRPATPQRRRCSTGGSRNDDNSLSANDRTCPTTASTRTTGRRCRGRGRRTSSAAGRNYWIVTASGEGRPHAMPTWGVWDDGEQRFAFSCGPRSRKAGNVAANPQIAVAVDDTVECLSVEGRAERVTDDARVGDVDRALPRQVPSAGSRPQRRLPPPEPDHRGRPRARLRRHRARGGVRHPRHTLALLTALRVVVPPPPTHTCWRGGRRHAEP